MNEGFKGNEWRSLVGRMLGKGEWRKTTGAVAQQVGSFPGRAAGKGAGAQRPE